MKRAFCALCVFLAMCCLPLLYADTMKFDVTLTGLQEVPPHLTPGTGVATVILDDVANSVAVDLTFSDLLGPTTAAHIHCCSGPGVNAPVVISFTAAGFPIGVTSGSYSHTFDGVSPATIAALSAGFGYINIHTQVYPGGEIRGDLVPEPASLLLLASGLLGLSGQARRYLTRHKG